MQNHKNSETKARVTWHETHNILKETKDSTQQKLSIWIESSEL